MNLHTWITSTPRHRERERERDNPRTQNWRKSRRKNEQNWFFLKEKKNGRNASSSLSIAVQIAQTNVCAKKKNTMTSRNPGDKNSMQLRTIQKTRRRTRTTTTTTQETFATEMVSLSTYRGNWVKLQLLIYLEALSFCYLRGRMGVG